MAKVKKSPWELQCYAEHESAVNTLALSSDESILASAGDDCSIKVWTTAGIESRCLGTLTVKLHQRKYGHKKYITSLAIEDHFIVSGSADRSVKKWDLVQMQCEYTYEGHTGMVNRVIIAGDFAISSSYDATIRLWLLEPNYLSNPCVRIFAGHSMSVFPIIFIPALSSPSNQTSDSKSNWYHDEGRSSQGFSFPDEEDNMLQQDLLISGSADATAIAWSIDSGRPLKQFVGHSGSVQCMSTDQDALTLFTGSADATIRSWDLETGEQLKVFEGHAHFVICMHVVGKFLYSGSSDWTARSWVVQFGETARTFKSSKHTISCIRYFMGLVVAGCGDGIVRAFDARSGNLKRVFQGHQKAVTCLEIITGRLFTVSGDGTLRIWKLDGIEIDGNELQAMKDKKKSKQKLRIRQ